MLLDDVEVVQQPVARRADVEPTLGPMIQLLVDSIENQFRVVEAQQQRARATLFLGGEQMMTPSNRARARDRGPRASTRTSRRSGAP